MKTTGEKPNIIVICGPTGIGKTGLSLDLAEFFNGEIVGADSMQIYRYMDIGTAKPTVGERKRVRHHMVDIVAPDESYDAARYAEDARKAVAGLLAKGKIPFVVGGTGLYIRALTRGIFPALTVPPEIRARFRKQVEIEGPAACHERLAEVDPESAARIHRNDAFRIVRALEVFEHTGTPLSEHHRSHRFSDVPYNRLTLGLSIPRERLYRRIDLRVDAMIADGLIPEVQALLDSGYDEKLKSMQSLGYRHMVDCIRGRMSLEEAVTTMKRDTRRYAKRQLSWFRAENDLVWADPADVDGVRGRVEKFFKGEVAET